jgi:aarF domain-containing kinase
MDIGVDPKNLDDIFKECTKSFEEEFDYRKEAGNMRLVAQNLAPKYGNRVHVPLPIDGKCTRKVLTMELLKGEPIKKRMARFMEEMAASQGKSKEQLEKEFKAQFEDPAELQKLLSKPPPSPLQIFAYQAFLRTQDGVRNTPSWLYNLIAPLLGKSRAPYKWSTLPLNAGAITQLLFDVHAHQLFVDGAFNADPHAGNILICEDGRLGLIDFGNVQRVPSADRRRDLARFYLALAKDRSDQPESWNDEEIALTFQAVGGKSLKSNVTFLAANALMGYDMRIDAATARRYGVKPDLSDVMQVINSLDSFESFPADLINLQRLCQTLVGVAGAIGAGAPSCAKMWQAHCEKIVKSA